MLSMLWGKISSLLSAGCAAEPQARAPGEPQALAPPPGPGPSAAAATARRRRQAARRLNVWTSTLNIVPVTEDSFHILATADISDVAAKQIEMDLHRTFDDEIPRLDIDMEARMRRVLTAWTASQPEVGYCQGLSFVAATLLRHFDEEVDAFNALRCLLLGQGLAELFSGELTRVMSCSQAFDSLLERQLPALREHLQDRGADACMFLTPWLMTLFTKALPASVAMIVMDDVAKEGLSFMVKFAYVLLETLQDKIMQMSECEDILHYLQQLHKSTLDDRDTKIVTRLLISRARSMALPDRIAALMSVKP